MSQTKDHCLNCGATLSGKEYCGDCSQRNIKGRLRLSTLIEDFSSQLLEWNLPWMKTLVEVAIRPGITAASYIEGRRVTYVNPLKYMVYVLGFLFLFYDFDSFLFSFVGLVRNEEGAIIMGVGKTIQIPTYLLYIFNNIPMYILISSPVTITLFWLVHLGKRNWVEVSCFVFYLIGQCGIFIFSYTLAYWAIVSVFSFPAAISNTIQLLTILFLPIYITKASMEFFKRGVIWECLGSLLVMAAYGWLLSLPMRHLFF